MSAPADNPFAAGFYARFYREDPQVLLNKPEYAILWKPHNLHSAPLSKDDRDNLLSWYLALPEIPAEARSISGKKPIECGLLHRLDFATAGLVLVAKTQGAFDFLDRAQKAGLFAKTYRAFCNCTAQACWLPDEDGRFCVKSRFRVFGPAGREVRPVFASEADGSLSSTAKGKKRISSKEYSSSVSVEKITDDGKFASILCSIELGFRHQVRAHLAASGFPICGDRLYNPLCKASSASAGCQEKGAFMQLVAVSLSFPDPRGGSVSFSLPPKDKTSLQSKEQPLLFQLPQARF